MSIDDRRNYATAVSTSTLAPWGEGVTDNLLRMIDTPVSQMSEYVTLDDTSRALLERIAVALEAMAGTKKRKPGKRRAG